MKRERKHYTGEEKVAILRRHLLEGEGVSKLCNELGLQPTVFYRWQILTSIEAGLPFEALLQGSAQDVLLNSPARAAPGQFAINHNGRQTADALLRRTARNIVSMHIVNMNLIF